MQIQSYRQHLLPSSGFSKKFKYMKKVNRNVNCIGFILFSVDGHPQFAVSPVIAEKESSVIQIWVLKNLLDFSTICF